MIGDGPGQPVENELAHEGALARSRWPCNDENMLELNGVRDRIDALAEAKRFENRSA
jgi:hypothetical protein